MKYLNHGNFENEKILKKQEKGTVLKNIFNLLKIEMKTMNIKNNIQNSN